MKIIVLKFGGTSVGSIQRIKKVSNIIKSYSKKYRVIVLSSAMSGTTNKLINMSKKKKKTELQLLNSLSKKILQKVKYLKGKTTVKTTAEEALKLGFGVCQDHVHIFLYHLNFLVLII